MLLSYKPLHLEAQQRLQEEGCVVDIKQFLAPLQSNLLVSSFIWYVLANPINSTKIDMHIGDIFIMTSAIIITTMDIQGVHTNNIAIMLIIQRFSAKHSNALFL